MKVLKVAAIVITAAVLIGTGLAVVGGAMVAGGGLGAAVSAGVSLTLGSAGLGLSGFALSAVLGVTAALDLAMLSSALSVKPSMGGSQTKWKSDPYAGMPYVMGRTLVAGNVVARMMKGVKNSHQGAVTVLSIGPINRIVQSFMNKTAVVWDGTGQGGGGGALTAAAAAGIYAAGTVLGYHGGIISTANANGLDYAGWVWEHRQLGACPEPTALGLSEGYSVWTSAHKLSGLAAVMNTFRYDAGDENTLTSLPSPAWIVEGVKVYDPRLDSTYPGGSGSCRALNESTYVYSENPHLHALTWALGRWQNGMRVAGIGAALSSIDVAAFVEGANLDDARGWKIGGQVYTRPDTPWNSLKAMLQAGGAQPIQPKGIISCVNRAPRVSLATITHADIVGKCSFTGTQPRRSRINGIIPQYRSEAHDWELVSAAAVSIDAYIAVDGEERTREVSYPLVQNVNQVSALAAYDICDAREAGPGTVPLGPAWLNYKLGDCVTFSPEDGWSVKAIITGRSIAADTGIVTYTLRSETDSKHAFALGQTGIAPPTASLTYDSALSAPTGDWTLTGTALSNVSGSSPALVLNGAVADPNADAVIIDYRAYTAGMAADEGWTGASTESPALTKKQITSVTSGTQYQVGVRYRVRGVISPRAVFGPVTSGASALAWAGVTGTGRPADNATVGAPTGTPVGSTTAAAVSTAVTTTIPAIQSTQTTQGSNITALLSTTSSQAVAIATAQGNITTLQGQASAAATNIATLQSTVASMSSGAGNLVPNPDFAGGRTDGWNSGGYSATATPMSYGLSVNSPSADWHPVAENVASILQYGSTGDQASFVWFNTVSFAVQAGKYYQAHCMAAAHRCNVEMVLIFLNDAGDWVGWDGTGGAVSVATGGTNTANYTQIGTPKVVQAPTGATRAVVECRKHDTFAGQTDSWAWFWRPYAGEARLGQTTYNPYSVGSAAASLASVRSDIAALTSSNTAMASQITSLNTSVGGLSSSVSSQALSIATLQSQAASFEQRLAAGSPNLLKNGSAELGMTGWYVGSGAFSAQGPDEWGTWFRANPNATGTYWITSEPILIGPNAAYTCAMDADVEQSSGTERRVWIELLWFATLADANALANEITPRTSGPALWSPWFGNSAANRAATKITATSPAGAYYVRVRPVCYGTNVTLVGFRGIKFERGDKATPYSQEATVLYQAGAISDAKGKLQSYLALSTSAGAATAAVRLMASSDGGNTYGSSVGLEAQEIIVTNSVGTSKKRALSISNGNAAFDGDIIVGGQIRYANGLALKLAVAPYIMTVADGDSITYPNAGYLPVPTFSTTGLAALGSGETYDLKLESQTAGGATVRLKIVTPATPSSTTLSTDAAGGTGNPTRVINKGAIADSATNSYTINASWRQTGDTYTDGGGLYYHDWQIDLTYYAKIGGSWVAIGTFSDSGTDSVAYAGTHVHTGSNTITLTAPTGVTDFGVSAAGGGSGQLATKINSVTWASAGTPSSTRSATPSGQQCQLTLTY